MLPTWDGRMAFEQANDLATTAHRSLENALARLQRMKESGFEPARALS